MINHRLHRFQKQITQIAILVSGSCLTVNLSYAVPISSTELLNSANQYNNKMVVYEGEVIGDVMARGSHAWLNLWDGINTIGVWTNKEMARDVRYAGRYDSKGDKLTIRGVFHKACPEHGGDLDIHAEKIMAHAYGERTSHPVDQGKVKTSIISCGVLVIVSAWWFMRKRAPSP